LTSSLEVKAADANNPVNESYVSILDAVLQGLVYDHLLKVSNMTEKLLINGVVGVPLLGWSPSLWFEG
jgi:hypothetical protein